jgi:hypothetical protein
MKITEYFAENGKIVERDATPEEVASWVVTPTFDEELEAKAAAKAALLERLNITADEAALLLG